MTAISSIPGDPDPVDRPRMVDLGDVGLPGYGVRTGSSSRQPGPGLSASEWTWRPLGLARFLAMTSTLPMPVAAAILRGAPITDYNPPGMQEVLDRASHTRAAVREATMVAAQPAADMYWLTSDYYDSGLRLPAAASSIPAHMV